VWFIQVRTAFCACVKLDPSPKWEQILIFEKRVFSRVLGLRNMKCQENGANCLTMIFRVVLYCAVLFFIPALVSWYDVFSCSNSNVVHFRVWDYFRWCVNIVPTWNLVWGSRLCFLPNLFFLPPFYLTSIPFAEQSLTSRLWSSQLGCSLQLYKRSWSPQSDH